MLRRTRHVGPWVGLAIAALLLLAGCGEGGKRRAGAPTGARKPARTTPPARQTASKPAMYVGEDGSRIGDAGLPVLDEPHADVYPQRRQWARAGVKGGIQAVSSPVVDVPIAGDIQAAIDGAQDGAVRLAAGQYELAKPLRMKSGVVLTGAVEGTTLRYGAQGGETAIRFKGVKQAALQGVKLVYADPEGDADQPHHQSGRYASALGFAARGAAVELTDCTDCWLQDVRIERPRSSPLVIRGSRHCTIRGLDVEDTLNRGPGAGAILIANSGHLLLCGWRIRGPRMIRLDGPVEWCVLRSGVLGCGVYLADADRVRGILVEDCHFLFRPGYPFRPFSKDPMPAGPDSRIVNCTTIYHRGTDAVTGQLLKPHKVYAINPHSDRVILGPDGGMTRARLVSPIQLARVIGAAPTGARAAVDVPATWDQPPDGVAVMPLRNGALVDDWVWTGSVGPKGLELPIEPLVSQPLRPGQTRAFGDKQVKVTRVPPEAKQGGANSRPAHIQAMVGRFGNKGLPAGGAELLLLGQTGGDWKGSLVLQQVVHIPGEPVIRYNAREIGCRIRVFIGQTELAEKRLYRLKPGCHPITVLTKLDRAMPLIDKAVLGLRFELAAEPEARTVMRDAPSPSNGFLYPYRAAVDPIAAERAALSAWPAYFAKLRRFPYPGRVNDTKALMRQAPETHVAWVAQRILEALGAAPHDEGSSLDERQWGRLADYYKQAGLWERAWTISKAKRFGTYREYYPGMEAPR